MKQKLKGYINKTIKLLKKPEMAILPANIAFNLILAIIPLLTVIVLVASYFDISIDLVSDLVKSFMPEQVSKVIIDVISGKGFDSNVGFFNVMAFIIASNGTYAIIITSNALYKIPKSDYLKNRISSILILIIVIILFLFLLVVPIFGNTILTLMQNAKLLSKYADEFIVAFNILKWPVTLFIIYFNIKLIYTVAPSKNIKSKGTTIGSIFTTIAWVICIVVFRFYLTYFARYDILYGNLSSIIIMMVWIFFLSYIFVFGMAINASQQEEFDTIEETQRLELERIKKAEERAEKKLAKINLNKKKKEEKKEKQKSKKETVD